MSARVRPKQRNRGGRVLGIDRMLKIGRQDQPLEAVEVCHRALRRGAEVGRVGKPAALLGGQVGRQGLRPHRLPLVPQRGQ